MSLSGKLAQIDEQRVVKARVGIVDSATYPDGESVAFVGYVNEYGYEGRIPERQGVVRHLINEKTGEFKKKGQFASKEKANFERQVTIPAYDLKIPSRPFFRTAIAKNRDKLGPMLIGFIGEGKSADEAMRLVCEYMVDELRESVITWEDPPNAASTVRKKGFNAPLRGEDFLLRNSFSYEISDD